MLLRKTQIIHVLFQGIVVCALGGRCCFAEPVVEGPEFISLGRVPENVLISGTLVLSNIGDTPLELSEFKRSCSCIQMAYPEEPIPAGSSFALEYKLAPGKSRGDRVTVIFKTNAPSTPQFATTFYANTDEAPYALCPTAFHVKKYSHETQADSVEILRSRSIRMPIRGARCETPGVFVSIVADDGHRAKVKAEVTGEVAGDIDTKVFVDVEGLSTSQIAIPLYVKVVPDLHAVPKKLLCHWTLGDKQMNSPLAVCKVYLGRRKKEDELTVSVEPHWLDAKVHRLLDEDVWVICVYGDEDEYRIDKQDASEPCLVDGTLEIKAADLGQELTVPIAVVCKGEFEAHE